MTDFMPPARTSRPAFGGATLPELLIALLVSAILLATALPAMDNLLAQQRVASATNAVIALMRLARSESMTGGPVMLCDANHACRDFTTTQHLILVRADPDNPHLPAPGPPLEHLTLPHATTVSWSRFRGNALTFQRSGILHFQNGHFRVCSGSASRRIIMNWAGRTRVEQSAGQDICVE